MDGLSVLLLVLVGSASGQLEGVTRGPGLTDAQRHIIVDKHNEYRRTAHAANMMKMTYSMALEHSAQRAADRCEFNHSPDDESFRAKHLNPPTGWIGENIYVAPLPSFDIKTAMDSWWGEIEDYHFTSRTCDEGKMCGHYTQMVWAHSSMVGCAVSKCDRVIKWNYKEGLLLFCQYAPGGNVRDMAPFTRGESCSACHNSSMYCDDGLCSYSPTGEVRPPTTSSIVTGDQVCQAREAPESFMCMDHTYYGGPPGGDAACARIFCSTSRLKAFCCSTESADGLPCGEGRMCLDGRCQTDPTSETENLKAGCLYGDQQNFLWDRHNHTCASMIQDPKYGRHHCNNDLFRSLCCHTCDNLRNAHNPGCPWGNSNVCSQIPEFLICVSGDATKAVCCDIDC